MSPNKHYVKGRNFEYARMHHYRDEGYTVIRASGSHGPFDLVAIEPNELVILIQCKTCIGEKQAFMLIRKFKHDPPLPPSDHYRQVMEVYVEDTKQVMTGEI
jgi:hypothetical protein